MRARNPEFVQFLVDAGALRFGDFTLKSGDRSPFFINLGDINSGRDLHALGMFLAQGVQEYFPGTTHLFGPAYKGISMATTTATALHSKAGVNVDVFFDRKEAKDHGEGGNYIGAKPSTASRIVIIDDVVSSGGTKLDAIRSIERDFKVRPAGILVCVDRTRKSADLDKDAIGLKSLIDILDIAGYLRDRADPRAQTIADFYEERT